MTTTPQAALLSDDEIERHFENNKSVPGRELRRLIGRSIEAAILAKLQATQAEPVQAGELPDERAAFERAMREMYDWQDHNFLRSDGYDYYADYRTESAWGGWIAALSARKPLTQQWEFFCDHAYFDMWAVRPIGSKNFDAAFHVASQVEAKNLCAKLNGIGLEVKP